MRGYADAPRSPISPCPDASITTGMRVGISRGDTMMKWPFSHLLALLLAPCAAYATDLTDAVVITATGYPVATADLLTSDETFDRTRIQAMGAHDIGDVLRSASGVELGRNGGPGQPTSAFVRGSESDHTLVLLEGVPINSATAGGAALANLDTQLLQRVELIKGPASVLWGTGAIGGVINVEVLPRTYTPGTQRSASLAIGGDNTYRNSVALRHTVDDWQALVALADYRTDGYAARTGSTIDRGFRDTSGVFGLSRKLGDTDYNLVHWQSQGRSEYLDFFNSPVDQDFVNSASIARIGMSPQPNWRSEITLSLVRDEVDQNQSSDHAHTARTGLAWSNTLEMTNGDILAAGVNATWEDVDILSFFSRYNGSTDYQEAFTQYDAWRGRHHLIAGTRVLNHADAGGHAVWNLAYGYQLSADTLLRATAGTAYRYPTATERFLFAGNPNLNPESSLALEIGIRQNLGPQQVLEASVYRNEIDNLIIAVETPPGSFIYRNFNVAKATIEGAEISYRGTHGPWQLALQGTLQTARDSASGARLLRRADYSTGATLGYTEGKIETSAQLLHSGMREDFGGVRLPAYTTVDLNGGYHLTPKLQLFAQLHNALDADYATAAGYTAQGRLWLAGLRYED